MKTIHEILTLMYQEYINDIDSNNPARALECPGLCYVIWVLLKTGKITIEERNIAKKYLFKNKPTKLYGYFWIIWERRYRLLWLEKHMAITK